MLNITKKSYDLNYKIQKQKKVKKKYYNKNMQLDQ